MSLSAEFERIFITGGAGFIGSNVANRWLSEGRQVAIFDNLSRIGSRQNLDWLSDRYRYPDLQIFEEDIRNRDLMADRVKVFRPSLIVHDAAQVAVTDSLVDPDSDWDINAGGTRNVVSAALKLMTPPVVIYAGTNKEYTLDDLAVIEQATRYSPDIMKQIARGIIAGVTENEPFRPQTPYGVSKGAGSLIVLYAHDEIPGVVVRQSCIAGRRQKGSVDQGWVYILSEMAHQDRMITIFGDGKQVRDVLDVDDLVDFYEVAASNPKAHGQVYNIGGGYENTLSLIELIQWLEVHLDRPVRHQFGDWRRHDQKWYVSDIRKAEQLGWRPKFNLGQTLDRLDKWVHSQL